MLFQGGISSFGLAYRLETFSSPLFFLLVSPIPACFLPVIFCPFLRRLPARPTVYPFPLSRRAAHPLKQLTFWPGLSQEKFVAFGSRSLGPLFPPSTWGPWFLKILKAQFASLYPRFSLPFLFLPNVAWRQDRLSMEYSAVVSYFFPWVAPLFDALTEERIVDVSFFDFSTSLRPTFEFLSCIVPPCCSALRC